MMNKKELELNELAELQNLANEGVIVDIPENIIDMLNEQAEDEDMTTAEFVEKYVDDLKGAIKIHDDGSIVIKGEGLIAIDDSNLDGTNQIDWLGKNSNFKELFNNSVKAEELVEEIYDTYFD